MATMRIARTDKARPTYLIVFLVLAVFTAMEVGIAYLDGLPHAVKVTALVALAATKVALVLLFFMHLKYDNRAFALPLALVAVLVIPLIVIITLAPPESGQGSAANSAVGGENGGGSAQAQSIDVSLTSFAISLSTESLPAGQVTFNVSNDATDMPHELTVIKTDMAPDQLPTANGQVDTSQVEEVGSTDNLDPGQSTTLSVELEPGSYVLICNIPGHYTQGMYLGVTVEGQGDGDQGGEQGGQAQQGAQQGQQQGQQQEQGGQAGEQGGQTQQGQQQGQQQAGQAQQSGQAGEQGSQAQQGTQQGQQQAGQAQQGAQTQQGQQEAGAAMSSAVQVAPTVQEQVYASGQTHIQLDVTGDPNSIIVVLVIPRGERGGSARGRASGQGGASTVQVVENTFSIEANPASVAPGTVTFQVQNQSQDLAHDFLVVRADQPANQLPTTQYGDVDESQVQIVGRTERIPPRGSAELTVDLAPGRYALISNVPGHYERGMYADFTVGQPGQAQGQPMNGQQPNGQQQGQQSNGQQGGQGGSQMGQQAGGGGQQGQQGGGQAGEQGGQTQQGQQGSGQPSGGVTQQQSGGSDSQATPQPDQQGGGTK